MTNRVFRARRCTPSRSSCLKFELCLLASCASCAQQRLPLSASNAHVPLTHLTMLAWMGGKRSKLKHAKKQEGPGRRSLHDKQAASVHRASKGKRTENPAQAGAEGVPSKRARTATTSVENNAQPAVLLLKQSSSSSSYQQDRFDHFPADTPKSVPVRQGSSQYCQATKCDEDTVHKCGQPEKGSVEHKYSKKANNASLSLDLQAIELPH